MEQESVLPEALDEDLRALAVRVNGFLYHGDRLEALIDTIKALRTDPDLTARLLSLAPPCSSCASWARIAGEEVEDGSDL